ncbi:MAG: hypothetical protein HQK56_06175 [Deltaproteobacteria bacterium]|nr:hypothetical protein [Deltaproteobacteria bacterium]
MIQVYCPYIMEILDFSECRACPSFVSGLKFCNRHEAAAGAESGGGGGR